MDYLHEEDTGKIFYYIGEWIEENQVYCIASRKFRALMDFILELKVYLGSDVKCEFAQETNREELISLQTDTRVLVEEIGYTPRTIFWKGIEDMIQYSEQIFKGGIKRLRFNNILLLAFMQPKSYTERGLAV